MKINLKGITYWRGALLLLVVYTCYDYYEHVSRSDDIFKDDWLNWALFTIMSTCSVILIVYFSSHLLKKIIPEIIASSLGIALAVFAHVSLTGPIWDKLFWNGNLNFSNFLTPTAAITIIYLLYRSFYYLVIRFLIRAK